MDIFKGLNQIEFTQRFSDEESCLRYLSEVKWSTGYSCHKCKGTKYGKGNKTYSRRCKECGYDESVTANTIFHKLKFSLVKAFHISFRISTKKKGMSSKEIATEVGIQQKSAWLFKRKLQQSMKSSEQHPLTQEVVVDEFVVGGAEEGKPGRSSGKKKKTIVMLEVRADGKVGRAYAKKIDNYKSETLNTEITKHIAKETQITTDKYSSYISLQKENKNIKTMLSDKGKNFPEIHKHIMNIKTWLRGIHHKVSAEHYQNYLDEFHYRFNRRNHTNGIFHNLITKIINHCPFTYNQIIDSCQLNA